VSKRSGGRVESLFSSKVAADFDVVPHLDGPITDLKRLEHSLLFAEMSMLSYLHDGEAQPVLLSVGFTEYQVHRLRRRRSVRVAASCRRSRRSCTRCTPAVVRGSAPSGASRTPMFDTSTE